MDLTIDGNIRGRVEAEFVKRRRRRTFDAVPMNLIVGARLARRMGRIYRSRRLASFRLLIGRIDGVRHEWSFIGAVTAAEIASRGKNRVQWRVEAVPSLSDSGDLP